MQNKPRLFCFTYAGGTREFFNIIEPDLQGINLIKLDYAGHGERRKEIFYHDFDALAEDMFQKIKDRLFDGNYALFGYSMGTISATEVLRKIITEDYPLPSNVFLAAHEASSQNELLELTDKELEEWVKKRTIQFGGVPEKLLYNAVYWRTYLPIYCADYAMIGKYVFEELDLNTFIPATIFYSATDTPLNEMHSWNKYYLNCEFFQYDGNHFFIKEHHREMAEIIRTRMGVQT